MPTRAAALEFVKSLYLPINHPAPNNTGRPATLSDIAGHYIQEELAEVSALFGLNHGLINQAQYSHLVVTAIGSAVVRP